MMIVVVMASAIFTVTLVSGDSTVENVVRRSSWDIYSTRNTTLVCSEEGDFTYLVDENTCVNNEDLMTGIIIL